MAVVKFVCPKAGCGKALSLAVSKPLTKGKSRCPDCGTAFAVAVTAEEGFAPLVETRIVEPLAAPAELDGGYGVAAESSLEYLIRRETDGHVLTAEQRGVKKKLIAERTEAEPRNCPACRREIGRKAVVCVGCGFDRRTMKRLKTETADERVAEAEAELRKEQAKSLLGGIVEIAATIAKNA